MRIPRLAQYDTRDPDKPKDGRLRSRRADPGSWGVVISLYEAEPAHRPMRHGGQAVSSHLHQELLKMSVGEMQQVHFSSQLGVWEKLHLLVRL